MPVIIEGISIVTRAEAIASKMTGGEQAFFSLIPNQTFCADNELTRVGFMAPMDAEAFVHRLTAAGLVHLEDNVAVDIVVVDQLRGPVSQCAWIEFGHIAIDRARNQKIAVCRLTGSQSTTVVMPAGWTFEKSLSNSHKFVPLEEISKTMKFLRRENGLDVYLDPATGKETFVGRPDL